MRKPVPWEDLWPCPEARPFWCSHPHCLWCNWDGEASENWTLAAHLGERPPSERRYDPRYPAGHYVQDRRYLAWLCEDCAADAGLASWFVAQVRTLYPDATIIRAPASPDEAPLDPTSVTAVPARLADDEARDDGWWVQFPAGQTPIGKPEPGSGPAQDDGGAMREAPTAQPTPYPEVNAVLALLLREVRTVLGDRLVGMYLYGSLSLGDFDPDSSDVDFIVVTEGELPEETLAALAAMHRRIAARGLPWADRLEGSYIPREAIRRYDSANTTHPTIGMDWDFGPGRHGPKMVLEHAIMREGGVALWGPPAATLIDPVSPEDLRAAVREILRDFWARQLDGPEWLRPRHYQAFAILTMCRALYTLDHGAVASKPVAAAWARDALGPPWAATIERALRWRHDHAPGDMTEMLAFIRYTLARVGIEPPAAG
ncbi:MAG TPA: aminoglycoside adenylyltransferase domain-containing protein [Thermomicrobiales bacterium]|nr:aminoglycoside adenylyltransferase domain-containing protein [Thermomicrobiales bacterium]